MKEMILDVYNMNEAEYKKLAAKYSDERIFKARTEFMMMEGKTRPVTTWAMLYYIEKHGDFINRGKLLHHKIARAIYESMNAKDKVEMLTTIEMHKEDYK